MDTTKINSAVLAKATAKYKNVALASVVIAGLFLFVGYFTQLVTAGLTVNASDNSYQKLTEERVKTELELKEAIAKASEAQKLADQANESANTLREKRKNLEESINQTINPAIKPEEVK